MQRRFAGTAAATRRAWIAGSSTLGLVVFAGGPVAAADALASGQFRDEVVEVLRAERPNWRPELPADPTALVVDHNPMYLGNLYQNCRGATASERAARILRFFDAMTSGLSEVGEKTFDAVRSRLRARIINAAAAANSADEKLMLLTRPFSAKARIGYVVDSPMTMAFVSRRTLDRWAVTADAVHAAAIANLDAASQNVPIEPHDVDPGSGIFVAVQGPDGYAAARLLAPKFMQRMSNDLGPEHFVGVPVRDLMIAWSVDCSIKPQLAAAVTKYNATAAYPLTDELFVWSGDGLRLANAAELADHGRG